jgi:hypothetical protein
MGTRRCGNSQHPLLAYTIKCPMILPSAGTSEVTVEVVKLGVRVTECSVTLSVNKVVLFNVRKPWLRFADA